MAGEYVFERLFVNSVAKLRSHAKFGRNSSWVYQSFLLADILMNNLYWRNTKASIVSEYTIPPCVSDVVLLGTGGFVCSLF